jgi:hypothetical protein
MPAQILFEDAEMTFRRKDEFEKAVIKYGLAVGK